MAPKTKITLNQWMQDNAEPGVIYHIGSGSSFVFIGDKVTYKKEMPTVSLIHKERLKYALKRAISLISVDTIERGKISIYSTHADIDRTIDYLIKQIVFEAHRARKAAKRMKTEYDGFINFGDRWVEEVYDRELGGVAILVEGDETGEYWFQDEYEKGMEKFRHLRGAASAKPAQIEKLIHEHEKEIEKNEH